MDDGLSRAAGEQFRERLSGQVGVLSECRIFASSTSDRTFYRSIFLTRRTPIRFAYALIICGVRPLIGMLLPRVDGAAEFAPPLGLHIAVGVEPSSLQIELDNSAMAAPIGAQNGSILGAVFSLSDWPFVS